MLTVIGIVLLCVLLLTIVLLAIPVELVFAFQNYETHRNKVSITWLSGVVQIPFKLASKRNSKKKPTREGKKKISRRKSMRAWSLMRNSDFRKRLFRSMRRLLRSIKIKTLDLQVRLGLNDPADTGRLWSVLGPLGAVVGGLQQANIRVEPEFSEEVFSLQSHGRIRIIPLQIISLCLLFFLSPTVIRAIAFKS